MDGADIVNVLVGNVVESCGSWVETTFFHGAATCVVASCCMTSMVVNSTVLLTSLWFTTLWLMLLGKRKSR